VCLVQLHTISLRHAILRDAKEVTLVDRGRICEDRWKMSVILMQTDRICRCRRIKIIWMNKY
jgi:hypothetical protein